MRMEKSFLLESGIALLSRRPRSVQTKGTLSASVLMVPSWSGSSPRSPESSDNVLGHL